MADADNNIVQKIYTQKADVPIEFYPASLLKRCLAYFIDLVIYLVTAIYLYNLILDVNLYTFFTDKNIFIWIVSSVIIFYQSYFFISEYFWKGKTIGKFLMNVQVVTKSGAALNFSASFVRNFSRIINFLPPLFFIPDLVCIFISKDHRSIGDFIAGCVVINAKKHSEKLN
ncbi:MAG: RDD family protein [Ignavibacteriales bacterium]|nr:MAG: RDD family protein [Ignavibacteriales bacterium]